MTARKTKQYLETAVESLTLAIELFNRPSPTGREHATVMLAAHAFEMLLKAAIFEQRKNVKFSGADRSFDLGKCVTIAETSLGVIDGGGGPSRAACSQGRSGHCDTRCHCDER